MDAIDFTAGSFHFRKNSLFFNYFKTKTKLILILHLDLGLSRLNILS